MHAPPYASDEGAERVDSAVTSLHEAVVDALESWHDDHVAGRFTVAPHESASAMALFCLLDRIRQAADGMMADLANAEA